MIAGKLYDIPCATITPKRLLQILRFGLLTQTGIITLSPSERTIVIKVLFIPVAISFLQKKKHCGEAFSINCI